MPTEPYQQQVFSFISSIIGQKNIIPVPIEFVRFTGGYNQAALLSQIIYWTDRTHDPDGWFYKSYQMWNDELALSKYQVMTAAKKLQALGLIKTKVKRANGDPTLHYMLIQDAFINLFGEHLNSRKALSTVVSKETSLTKVKELNYPESRNSTFITIQKLPTETTTTTQPQPLSILPEKYNTAVIQTLILKALKTYSEDYIRESISYAVDNSNGGTVQKFKAYLDKTIKGGWAAGYKSEKAKSQDDNIEHFKRMPLENLKMLAASKNVFALQELARR